MPLKPLLSSATAEDALARLVSLWHVLTAFLDPRSGMLSRLMLSFDPPLINSGDDHRSSLGQNSVLSASCFCRLIVSVE